MAMPCLLQPLPRTLVSSFQTRFIRALENLVLRQQVALLKFAGKRPAAYRFLWVISAPSRSHGLSTLLVVLPLSLLRWHQEDFAVTPVLALI